MVSSEDEKAQMLASVLGVEDLDFCRRLLEAHGYDLDAAVNTGLSVGDAGLDAGDAPFSQEPPAPAPRPARQPAAAPPRRDRNQRHPRVDANNNPVVGLPVAIVRASFGLVFAVVGFGFKVAGGILNRVLPPGIARRVRTLPHTVGGEVDEPVSSAAAFKREFQAKYGAANTPNFVEASHKDALMIAQNELKFLFVYLHSPTHDEVPAFCRDVLASPAVSSFLNDNFISWAGDIRKTDAFQLAAGVAPSTFPYVALLSSVNSRVSLVMTCEGAVTPDHLLSLLTAALESSESTMAAARVNRQAQDANRRIREEQDAAFMESLAADAAREEAAAAAAAEEELARAEEERTRRREAEEAEAARLAEEERLAAIERRREEKAAALAVEPEAGGPGVSKVGVRLPDGTRKERRFLSASASVSDVFNFVDTLEGVNTLLHYSLVSNFPRRVFKRDADAALSLVDAGLHPQAMLFVQSEDE